MPLASPNGILLLAFLLLSHQSNGFQPHFTSVNIFPKQQATHNEGKWNNEEKQFGKQKTRNLQEKGRSSTRSINRFLEGKNGFLPESGADKGLQNDFYDELSQFVYTGGWSPYSIYQKQFNYFVDNPGEKSVDFMISNESSIRIIVYNTFYVDDSVATLEVPFNITRDLNTTDMTIELERTTVQLELYNKIKIIKQETCDLSASFSFVNQTSGLPWSLPNASIPEMDQDLQVKLSINSTNCSVGIYSNLMVDQYDSLNTQGMYYGIGMGGLLISQICFMKNLGNHLVDNPENNRKVSLVTMGWILSLDSFYMMFHGYIAFMYSESFQIFQTFIILSMFYLVLVMLYEYRFFIIIWKFRYDPFIQNQEQLRTQYFNLTIKYYLGVLFTVTFMFIFFLDFWVYFFLFSLGLPQIFHIAKLGQRKSFWGAFMFGAVLLKPIPLLYMRGWPMNIYRLRPDYLFLESFIIYFLAQSECAICMTSVAESPAPPEEFEDTKESLRDPLQRKQKTLSSCFVTPCKHKFHEECLVKWMDIKLECPSCRSQLPTLD